jgi:hypothetical protein
MYILRAEGLRVRSCRVEGLAVQDGLYSPIRGRRFSAGEAPFVLFTILGLLNALNAVSMDHAGGGPNGSHTVRDRSVSAAAHLQYIRAGKVRERELAPLGLLLHHLTPSPPLSLMIDLVSVFVCGVCVCLCVCAPHSAPPTLCLHGTCAVRLAEMAIKRERERRRDAGLPRRREPN